MENIFETGDIGMLFMVPGMAEVLRINGTRAHHRRRRRCWPPRAVQGRAPKIGVLVQVSEAYLHCAKAINRAGLWDPSRHIDRNDAAELRRHAGRSLRRPHPPRRASGRAPRWRAAACIDGAGRARGKSALPTKRCSPHAADA